MIIDPTEHREAKTSPMQIAHSPLFTAREKLEMLSEIKAEVTGGRGDPGDQARGAGRRRPEVFRDRRRRWPR